MARALLDRRAAQLPPSRKYGLYMPGENKRKSIPTSKNKRTESRVRLFALLATLCLAAAAFVGIKLRSANDVHWLKTAPADKLLQASRQRPNDGLLFQQLGLRQREEGRLADAALSFQRAVELLPDDEETWNNWADTVGQARGAAAQLLVLTTWEKTLPQSGRVRAKMAEVQYLAGNYPTAETRAREAATLAPDLADGWRILGQLALLRQDYSEAVAVFEEAKKRDPKDWRNFLGLTKAALAKPDPTAAVAAARQMIALAPNEPVAQLYMARALLVGSPQTAQIAQARKLLSEALRPSPGLIGESRFDALFYLGDSFAAQSRWQEALPYFEAAEKIAPGSARVQFRLERAYTQIGQSQKAKAARSQYQANSSYENATKTLRLKIAANPYDAQLRLDLARLYARNGNYIEAGQMYQILIAKGLAVETSQKELALLGKR